MKLFPGWPILCFDDKGKTSQELMAINLWLEVKAHEVQEMRALAN
jgi:hypothetical protein